MHAIGTRAIILYGFRHVGDERKINDSFCVEMKMKLSSMRNLTVVVLRVTNSKWGVIQFRLKFLHLLISLHWRWKSKQIREEKSVQCIFCDLLRHSMALRWNSVEKFLWHACNELVEQYLKNAKICLIELRFKPYFMRLLKNNYSMQYLDS